MFKHFYWFHTIDNIPDSWLNLYFIFYHNCLNCLNYAHSLLDENYTPLMHTSRSGASTSIQNHVYRTPLSLLIIGKTILYVSLSILWWNYFHCYTSSFDFSWNFVAAANETTNTNSIGMSSFDKDSGSLSNKRKHHTGVTSSAWPYLWCRFGMPLLLN